MEWKIYKLDVQTWNIFLKLVYYFFKQIPEAWMRAWTSHWRSKLLRFWWQDKPGSWNGSWRWDRRLLMERLTLLWQLARSLSNAWIYKYLWTFNELKLDAIFKKNHKVFTTLLHFFFIAFCYCLNNHNLNCIVTF